MIMLCKTFSYFILPFSHTLTSESLSLIPSVRSKATQIYCNSWLMRGCTLSLLHFCEKSGKDFLSVSVFAADSSYYNFYSGLNYDQSASTIKKVPLSVLPIGHKIRRRKNISKTNLSVTGLLKISL